MVLLAGVAQLVEQLICNQQVAGSSPIASSNVVALRGVGAVDQSGQVAKRSNATDCKSVGFGLRRFKSSPAHPTNVNCQSTIDNQRCGSNSVGRVIPPPAGLVAGWRRAGDMSCWVYVLKSLSTDCYYIGSTEDVGRRVEFHNSPRARWTKRHQPWELVHSEEFRTRSEAVKRERRLKCLKGMGRRIEAIRRGEA